MNINAPTAQGVSHNKFTDFNVDRNGLIVNNLNLRSYHTDLKSVLSGGHVEFNRNFGAGGAAKVILNEVTSNNTTALRGYTEIYGHKADYIVANPNGITCNGCGFLNIGRLSLVTGSANMAGGEISGFNMGLGTLQINGVGVENFGLYAPSSADLVSNAVRIAGEVHVGENLNIYSGNGKFDYKNKVVGSAGDSGVGIAVDSSGVGGMYAGSVRVVATQKGFGVNLAGDVVSDIGDVEITADGNIAFKTVAARKELKAASASGDIRMNGGDARAQKIHLAAASGIRIDGMIVAGDIVADAGKDFTNTGKIRSDTSLEILAGNDITNTGQMDANGGVALAAARDIRSGGVIVADGIVADAGGDFTNTGTVYADADLEILAGKDITNTGQMDANGGVALAAARDTRNDGGIISGAILVDTASGFTNTGEIHSNKNLEILAGDIINTGRIYATGEMALAARNDIRNGTSKANAPLSLIAAGGDLHIASGRNLWNAGKINVGGSAFLDALNLHNYGQILANRDLEFAIRQDLINYRAAGILAGGNMSFQVGRNLVNYRAEIFALGDIAIKGHEGASVSPSNPVQNAALYENHYIDPEKTIVVDPPELYHLPEEPVEYMDMRFLLEDGAVVVLPGDAFPDDAPAGSRYESDDGYIFIVGTEVVSYVTIPNPDYAACTDAGNSCGGIPRTVQQAVYDYAGTDTLTLKGKAAGGSRATLAYTIIDPEETASGGDDAFVPSPPPPPPALALEDIPVINGTGQFSDRALDGYVSPYDAVLSDIPLGTLLNWGGRIEAGGDITVAAGNLLNQGVHINTGYAAYDMVYHKLRDRVCGGLRTCGWTEMGRYILTKVNLDSIAGVINAGGSMSVDAGAIRNESSVLSARNDMLLNAKNSVENITYSEVVSLAIYEQRRVWRWRGFRSWFATENNTKYDQKRIYSKQRAAIHNRRFRP